MARDQAMLYSGLIAAAMVYVILGIFAWIAYHDEGQTATALQQAAEGDKKTD